MLSKSFLKESNMFKSIKILAVAVAAALTCGASFAGQEIEATYKSIDYTGGFADGSSQGLTYRNTFNGGYVAGSVNHLSLFNTSANIYSVWGSYDLDSKYFVTGSFSSSDKGLISHKNRGGVGFGARLGDGVVVSLSTDSFNMRNGSNSDGLTLQAIKYFQSMPLVLQSAYTYRKNNPGSHNADAFTLVGTYGKNGDWQATVGLAYTEAKYQTVTRIPAYADYDVNRQFVGFKNWFAPNWGVNVQVEWAQNKFFHRNEISGSVFYNF